MTTKTKTPKTDLGLYVVEQHDHGYYHVIATVVTIGPTARDRRWHDESDRIPAGKLRNPWDDLENGLYLKDLRVHSQGNTTDTDRHLYAWDVRYQNVFSIDAKTAGHMAHTLKTIERRMTKQEEQYGRPSTFGAYLARVANAIGADEILMLDDATAPRGWSYDDVAHRRMTIRDGVTYVDWLIRKWARPTPAPVAETA